MAYQANNMPKPTIPPITPENRPPVQDQQSAELEAEKAKQKRRRSYANMGRRSTILTGPDGFDFNAAAERLYGNNQGSSCSDCSIVKKNAFKSPGPRRPWYWPSRVALICQVSVRPCTDGSKAGPFSRSSAHLRSHGPKSKSSCQTVTARKGPTFYPVYGIGQPLVLMGNGRVHYKQLERQPTHQHTLLERCPPPRASGRKSALIATAF